ncbi:MAG: Ig-like domain-containing protein [Pirellulaceae bacterium]
MASQGYYNTPYYSSLTIAAPGVLSNDVPWQGLPPQLTAQLAHGPAHAESFSLSANGSFTYDPVNSFTGTDYFYYRVIQNGVASKKLGIVSINVPSPPPPAPSNDFYMTSRNNTLNVSAPGVLGNDSNADAAQYIAGSGPAHGSLSFNSNGGFSYTPATNYTGSDSFQYNAQNSVTGQSAGPATVQIYVMQTLTLDEAPQPDSTAPAVTLADIEPLYREAVRRWHEAGVPRHVLEDRLASVVFVLADITGSGLAGATEDGTIVIDVNAAGHGWYLDSTPRDDGEFQLLIAPSERKAIGSSAAVGYVDLLTAITHEVGHVLGLEHSEREGGHSVMSPTLGLSTRRIPTLRDVAILELLDGWDRRRR